MLTHHPAPAAAGGKCEPCLALRCCPGGSGARCTSISRAVTSPMCVLGESAGRARRRGPRSRRRPAGGSPPSTPARRAERGVPHSSWPSSAAARSPAASAGPTGQRRPSRCSSGPRSGAARCPRGAAASRSRISRSRAISLAEARSAASRAAVPATAAWTSPSSRRSVLPSSRSRPRDSSVRASSEARTKLPPPRPRRVSHQAAGPQIGQRLAQGHRRDVEHGGQLGLGRQLLAVDDHAERDRAAQPADHRLAAPRAVVERREHRSARVAGEQPHQRTSRTSRLAVRRVWHRELAPLEARRAA